MYYILNMAAESVAWLGYGLDDQGTGIWFLEGAGIFSKLSWGQYSLIFIGNWGSFPGVKADDPSPFSAMAWVKIHNSTPLYALMVHTGPTSLRLLNTWVQFYVLNVTYIVCTLIHWGRSVFTHMGTYLHTAVRISHIHSYVTLFSKAVYEELSSYQTGDPSFIFYHMWTGWCSMLTSLSKSRVPQACRQHSLTWNGKSIRNSYHLSVACTA